VQPDLMVVCDLSKVDWRGVRGAPDLVIEILSDSTRRLDRLTKFNWYRQAGVREYWIVDPAARNVTVYTLSDGAYREEGVYGEKDAVPVNVLAGCAIDMAAVFPPPDSPWREPVRV